MTNEQFAELMRVQLAILDRLGEVARALKRSEPGQLELFPGAAQGAQEDEHRLNASDRENYEIQTGNVREQFRAARLLEAWRKKYRYTQAEAARIVGVSKSTISNLETGKYNRMKTETARLVMNAAFRLEQAGKVGPVAVGVLS